MLADVLTKMMKQIPPYLLHVLKTGRLSLVASIEAKIVTEGRMPRGNGEDDFWKQAEHKLDVLFEFLIEMLK